MPEEILLSPGVLAIENDQSFITQQPVQAGAAIIGPTVKGPVGIPTIVTSYSDYLNKFGSTFISGSNTYTYFTSISTYNYFNNGGNSLLVTRVVSGSFTPATSSNITNNVLAITGNTSSLSIDVSSLITGSATGSFQGFGLELLNQINETESYYYVSIPNTGGFSSINYVNGNQTNQYVAVGSLSDTDEYMAAVVSGLNQLSSFTGITASYSSPNLTLDSISTGEELNGTIAFYDAFWGMLDYLPTSSLGTLSGGTANTGDNTFVIETLSKGDIMNSTSTQFSDGSLESGSADNLRWQIISPNTSSGTFGLLIRRGNDNTNSPVILESYSNLSLDPYSPNYIEKIIGNQLTTIANDGSDYYTQLSGEYPNVSSYVRIKQVNYKTPNYLDNSGNPQSQYTASIPVVGSGSFGGAEGTNIPSTPGNYYENISNTNSQGIPVANYTESIYLLANKDAYRFNFITVPGLVFNFASHTSALNLLISNCQNNGNSMVILDTVGYGATIGSTVSSVSALNNSYSATYWPWLQTIDPNTGQQVWVPASTMIPGVYAFNDNIANPWNAPAGINRGVISNAIQAERYLTQGNRDTLYEANVNPISTFPNSGVTVFGQKTLQKKASALDRVNVRRLLIELKNYITQVADALVFEQNTISTRNNFLLQVNPYLNSVQQRGGLYSFRVVMDETNNTSTVIDNNQLVGAIYLQPTKTAEFIYLNFNVTSTGVSFE